MTDVKKVELTPVGDTSTLSGNRVVSKAPAGTRRGGAKVVTRTGPFIKYVGEASHRKISAADWSSLPGMEPPAGGYQDNTWEPNNDKMIECAAFSDQQLDYLVLDDTQPSGGQSFLEMDYDSEGNLVQVVTEA